VKDLTADAMRRAAERYIDTKRYVRVTLMPEAGEAAARSVSPFAR
jgi:NAD(P)H-hydrate repair Nnr-like enzyme with NAD(P)H-hydrate epimerase domain